MPRREAQKFPNQLLQGDFSSIEVEITR